MATITVETGSGSSTANSYVSVADCTTYASNRGITFTGDISEMLIKAMDYIEQKRFIGDKYTEAQALQWPRSNACVDGYSIDVDEIPQLLIDAQCEAAISFDLGDNPLANQQRETSREKIDVIEVEYSPNALNTVYLTATENKLCKLVIKNTGSFRV